MTGKTEPVREAPDRREREEALDPAGSFIVQAPAGSGKTTLLIQRFLVLLAHARRPEEILAITFTRKAAGQMHGRIMAALERAASGATPADHCERRTLKLAEEALLQDRARGWKILENPSRLRVQTIDSFSAMLVRRTPLLSRLGTEPSVTERPWPLYEEAARRTLALLEEESALGRDIMQLLRYNDNNAEDLLGKIEVMLAKRDQWLRHIAGGGQRPRLEDALQGLVEDALSRAAEAFPRGLEDDFCASARYAAEHVADGNEIRTLQGLTGLPAPRAANLGAWKAVAALLTTNARETAWRKPGGVNKRLGFPSEKTRAAVAAKEGFKDLLEALSDCKDLLAALSEVRRLPWPRYEEEDWKTLCALVNLLPEAVSQLNEVFMEEGVLDFPALSLGALEALGRPDMPTDLLLGLDNSISHILVDEFQDTSWTQIRLIEALTEGWVPGDGRTLFLVGDPMQSIYRFRDADVGLFLRSAREGLRGLRPRYIRLRTNFRSTAPLVDWVNRTIGPAFPPLEDPLRGAVAFAESESMVGRGGPGVSMRVYTRRDDEREAWDVLEIIRGLPPGSTKAVLGRTREHLRAIVERFRTEGLVFQAKDLEPLEERPVISDLLALERALLDPMDRVAWLAVLRAGWCGLGLADLHALLLGSGTGPVWGLLGDENRLRALSDDGRERVLRFHRTMSRAVSLKGRTSARRLLEGLWTALGGPALYGDDENAMAEAGRFFDIVETLDRTGEVLTAEVLTAQVKGLYAEASPAPENAVQVMTIHGAKGLEFDYVILPGFGKKARRPDSEILYWLERGEDLILAPMRKKGDDDSNHVYEYIRGVYAERQDLEDRRLLYVAATRAAKGLYLLGHAEEKEGRLKTVAGSFLRLIEFALEEKMILRPGETGERGRDVSGAPRASLLRRLALSWRLPEPAPPCRGASRPGPDQMARPLERPVFDWAGREARQVGTVVHGYLYRVAVEGLDRWDRERVVAERPAMEAMLRGLGLNRVEAGAGAKRCVEIVCKALADERGRWVLGAQREAGAEVALTGLLDGVVRRVVIDRTFLDEDGTRWIIDYKTGEHRGGSLERFLAQERERYRPQLEGYARLLLKASRGRAKGLLSSEGTIRKGLYYPAIPAWCEL